MTSQQQARELALALPDTRELDHHGRPSFRVAGKIFATFWDGEHINLMLDRPGIYTATQQMPDICSEVWWGKKLSAVRVNLTRVTAETLADLLLDAWEHRAPGGLVRQIRRT